MALRVHAERAMSAEEQQLQVLVESVGQKRQVRTRFCFFQVKSGENVEIAAFQGRARATNRREAE